MAVASKRPHDPSGQRVSVVVIGHHGGLVGDAQPGGVLGEQVGRGDGHRHRRRAVGEVVAPVHEGGARHVPGPVAVGVGAVARLGVGHLAAHVQHPHVVEVVGQPPGGHQEVGHARECYFRRRGPRRPPLGSHLRHRGAVGAGPGHAHPGPPPAVAVRGRPLPHGRRPRALPQAPAADGPRARAAALAAPADQPPGRPRRAGRPGAGRDRARRAVVRAARAGGRGGHLRRRRQLGPVRLDRPRRGGRARCWPGCTPPAPTSGRSPAAAGRLRRPAGGRARRPGVGRAAAGGSPAGGGRLPARRALRGRHPRRLRRALRPPAAGARQRCRCARCTATGRPTTCSSRATG